MYCCWRCHRLCRKTVSYCMPTWCLPRLRVRLVDSEEAVTHPAIATFVRTPMHASENYFQRMEFGISPLYFLKVFFNFPAESSRIGDWESRASKAVVCRRYASAIACGGMYGTFSLLEPVGPVERLRTAYIQLKSASRQDVVLLVNERSQKSHEGRPY